jgi:hypothetical protein
MPCQSLPVYELHRAPPLVPAAVSAVFRAASEFAPQAPSAHVPPGLAAAHVTSQSSLVVVCSTQDPGVTIGGGGGGVGAGGGGGVGGVGVGGVGVGGGV